MTTQAGVRQRAAAALLVGGLLLVGMAPDRVASSPPDAAPIAGVVYRDSNGDGARGWAETGEAGLTVTATDSTGATATDVTDANGEYSLDLAGFDGGRVRVELGALPDYLESAPHGTSSNGMVSFVMPGVVVDIGVTNPDEHCQSNPRLVVSCFAMGGAQSRTLYSTASVSNAANNIDADSTTPGNDPRVSTATQEEIGSVAGAAYQRSTQTQFWGAYLKRHAALGPAGPGGIYRLAPGPDGLAGTGDDEASVYVDINSVFPGNPAGVDPRPPGFSDWVNDTTFDQVGKTAFGDLEMSPDGRYLLAVNLADRQLYRIDTQLDPSIAPGADQITRTHIPLPANCPAADVRPFGVGTHDGVTYVGSVCSGESSNTKAALRAYVHVYDVATSSFDAAPVLDESLTFQRGCASRHPIMLTCERPGIDRYWNPWRPSFALGEWSRTNFVIMEALSRPTPMLGDIAFAGDSMVLGFRDRAGDQIGFLTQSTPGGAFQIGTTGGDQLLACRTSIGTWKLESNGSSDAECASSFSSTSGGVGNTQGPGGGEFYAADASTGVLDEISMGMIASLPGTGETAFTTLDPRGVQLEGGIRWYSDASGNTSRILSNSNGSVKEMNHQYAVYNAEAEINRFGKANGLGDLEALCDEAPLEIGNRVWLDSNDNGVQDPDEPGIPGVTVTLHDAAGAQLATATTSAVGQYWFGSADDPNVADNAGPEFGLVAAGLSALTNYEIRVGVSTASLAGIVDATPSQLALADRDQGASDTIDSDADPGPLLDVVKVTTGRVGQSDHSYDIGYAVRSSQRATTTTAPGSTTVVSTTVPPPIRTASSTTTLPLSSSTTSTTSTVPNAVASTSTTTAPVTSTSSPEDPPSVSERTDDPPDAPPSSLGRRLAVTGTSAWSMFVGGIVAVMLGVYLLCLGRIRAHRVDATT